MPGGKTKSKGQVGTYESFTNITLGSRIKKRHQSMVELEQLSSNGYTRLGKLIDDKKITSLVNKAEKILEERIIEERFVGSYTNALLYSPFFDHKEFMDILLLKKIHEILKVAMDEDFTLMHYAAGNRSTSALKYKNEIGEQIRKNVAADKWHVDSRYTTNRSLGDGFSFILIVVLDEFYRRMQHRRP